MLHDLKVATVFLTRLPVRVEGPLAMCDLAAAVHLFPAVGALVGLFGAVFITLVPRSPAEGVRQAPAGSEAAAR